MLLNYLTIAWKVLLRHPFYTFITLFGISLTLTVLMLLTAFLDHAIGAHYPETRRDRTLYVERMSLEDSAQTRSTNGPLSFRFLSQYTKNLSQAEQVTVFSTTRRSSAFSGTQRIMVDIRFTDVPFWQVAQFAFLEGRPYNAQDLASNRSVVVITDGFKRAYFGSNTDSVVGQPVTIENVRYTVVGVVRGVPPTRLFTTSDLYFPYTTPKSNYQSSGWRGDYQAMLLARTAADRPRLKAEFQGRMAQVPMPVVQYGFKYNIMTVYSEPFLDNYLNAILNGNSGLRYTFLGLLTFLVLMLVGLPAVNLVSLNVGRMLERASEIGVRKAFGAPVRSLLWQFIIENIFVTLLGGVIALLLTSMLLLLINQSGWIPYADLTINGLVFLVSLLIALLFGLLSGVLPALRMARLNIISALRAS